MLLGSQGGSDCPRWLREDPGKQCVGVRVSTIGITFLARPPRRQYRAQGPLAAHVFSRFLELANAVEAPLERIKDFRPLFAQAVHPVNKVTDHHGPVHSVQAGDISHDLSLVGVAHLHDLFDVLLLPLGRVTDDAAVGRRTDPAADAEHDVHVAAEAAPPVPAEDELVEIGVEMLLAEAVERAHSPPLQVPKNHVDPFEYDVRGQVQLR